MELVPFAPRLAPGMARLFNELIAGVPETAPVPDDWLADPRARRGLHHDLSDRPQEIVVAEEAGEVVGFAHTAIAPPPKEDWHPKGEPAVIRCLAYRPGARRAGVALLDWAEGWARTQGKAELIAWHALYGYPYQSPWTNLSDHLGHVRSLFGMAGYEPVMAQLYLVWPDFTPPAAVRPDLAFEVHREDATDGPWPRRKLTARQGKTWLGECSMDRGHASPVLDADRWCYCAGLHVAEAWQGKRLGRCLLCLGLQDMYDMGCRHASISTSGDNYRAELMYTNMGYRHVDFSNAWRKGLEEASRSASRG